jgi:hypothetical protein
VEALAVLAFGTFFVGVGMLGTAFWIWVLIDCARHEPRKGNDRIVWVLIIALTHLVGALIYFFARRPERIREHGV